MTDREKLIARLREIASLTPPICQYDRPFEFDVMDKKITAYCKPFEQFQDLLREAADALANGVVVREKGEWVDVPYVYFGAKRYMCSQCSNDEFWNMRIVTTRDDFCPNCGADMTGGERRV